MKRHIHKLERLAADLRKAAEKMAADVREGGRQSQEGFEKVLRAAHRLRIFLFSVPDSLIRIAQALEEAEENE